MTRAKLKVYRDLMETSGQWADKSRREAEKHGVAIVNLIGSPGCGKTRLIEAMAEPLHARLRFAVIEGDVETTRDADRLHALTIPVSQIITGGSCHLSPQIVHTALLDLPLQDLDLVVVENVGNLVCPAEFDIGEVAKIAMLSVTEGEDKPVKYPLLFRQAGAIVLSKTDLLPHLSFQRQLCVDFIRQINATAPLFEVSAASSQGTLPLTDWLCSQVQGVKRRSAATTSGNGAR